VRTFISTYAQIAEASFTEFGFGDERARTAGCGQPIKTDRAESPQALLERHQWEMN
jgi:hypothetical protein